MSFILLVYDDLANHTSHKSDSEGCTIVTIERHSSDRLSAGPLYMRIYARSTRTRARSLRVFLLYRVDNRIHAYSTRTAPLRASAELLANYNLPVRVNF
jgi:hypothetical protein